MITLCQTVIVVIWFIGLFGGLIQGTREKREDLRLIHILTTLITSGLLLICYIKTGALDGFLFL